MVCFCAAFPGKGGSPGAGGSQRASTAGGDPHGQGGGSAQRPPPPGIGELPDCPAAELAQGEPPSLSVKEMRLDFRPSVRFIYEDFYSEFCFKGMNSQRVKQT